MPWPKRDRKSTRLNSSHPSISYSTLSLHDALPIFTRDASSPVFPRRRIWRRDGRSSVFEVIHCPAKRQRHLLNDRVEAHGVGAVDQFGHRAGDDRDAVAEERSEEHTSELQSPVHLVLHSFPTRRSSDLYPRRVVSSIPTPQDLASRRTLQRLRGNSLSRQATTPSVE